LGGKLASCLANSPTLKGTVRAIWCRMKSPSYEPGHCIVCGHAQSEVVAEAEEIRDEVEALWAFHGRRLKPGTPVERLRDRVAFSQHPPFRLVACADCGLVYRNPTERAFELESSYARDCPPREMLQALHDAQRESCRTQADRLRELVPHGATVLEVGSYVGAFLFAAREAGLNAVGIDINPAVNRFTRSLGFAVHDGELPAVDTGLVDAIAIWNTFDQLADPRAVTIAARARLRPGGVVAIRVPNGGFYRKWRRRLSGRTRAFATTALAHNNLLTFPYRWGFTARSLGALLREAGLDPVKSVGDCLVPTADSWTRPWARFEERVVKGLLAGGSRIAGAASPWLEIYATAPGPTA
jgi:SAM-dependent methyltransferase